MEVKKINVEGYKTQLEEFSKLCPNITFFHSSIWLSFLEYYYKDSKPNHYALFDEDKIIGFLPSFIQRKDMISLPYSGLGGLKLLNYSKEVVSLFVKAIKNDLEEDSTIELISFEEETARCFKKHGFYVYPSKAFPTLRITSEEEFWSSRTSTQRKEIKKALRITQNSGLRIRLVKNESDIKQYYALEKENMSRKGTEAMPYEYWKTLFEKIPDENKLILLVEKDSDPELQTGFIKRISEISPK